MLTQVRRLVPWQNILAAALDNNPVVTPNRPSAQSADRSSGLHGPYDLASIHR